MKIKNNYILVIIILAIIGMMRFLVNIEDVSGIQSRKPDMDYYEIHNELYYYTSFEKGFFTFNPKTNEIVKLSNDKVAATSIRFYNESVFIKTYRGNSLIKMDERGGNRIIVLDNNCYKYRVYNEKIYFISDEDRKLYSCSLEGENITIEFDGIFSGLRVEEDCLYMIGKQGQSDIKFFPSTNEFQYVQ